MSCPHQAPDMELVKSTERYAFTLSPANNDLNVIDEEYAKKLTVWYAKILQVLFDDIRFMDFEELRLEVSKTGRPHIHGYVVIRNVVGSYTRDLSYLKAIGTYCIKELKEPLSDWYLYIVKQDSLIKPIFDKLKLEYPRSVKSFSTREDIKKEQQDTFSYKIKNIGKGPIDKYLNEVE